MTLFHPCQELLNDVRLAVIAEPHRTHVIAIFRDELSQRGSFREYDNDSAARAQGKFNVVTARNLWGRSMCQVYAIARRDGALHTAAGELELPAPRNSIVAARRARRRAAGA